MNNKLLQKLKKLIRRPGLADNKITKQDIVRHLPSPSQHINILEAGAANGVDTVEFATFFPYATIYAFEPVSKNYDALCLAVKGKNNVKTFKLALAEENGESEIHVSHNKEVGNTLATASSLLRPKEVINFHPHLEFVTSERVKTMTIDKWAQEYGVDHIDIMWLDMQGIEFQVLRASPRMLNTAKVIYSEVSLKELYEGSILYDQYKQWMSTQGFRVVKEELLWEDAGNVLFVRA